MTRVLLVEDNRADARLFSELLREVPATDHATPFELTTAETLRGALVVAPGHDIIFLDLSLPDAHGVSTLSLMRAAAPAVPIVVLTGSDDDRLALEAMAAGAQDYLRKSEINPALIARTAWYAIARRRVDDAVQRAVVADEATRRAKFLGSVTEAITASLDLATTLGAVTRLLVPTLGDFCVVDLVHDGRIARVAHAARDPELERILGASAYRFSTDGSPVRAALDSGVSLVLGADDLAKIAPEDDSYRRATAHAGARSMIIAPLRTRGRVVGAITLISTTHRTYADAERQLLVEDVAQRIASGIDNARLYSTAQQAIAARDDLLAVVSHDLRNPLGVVALALDMIEREPAEMAATLPRAKRAVERMQRLIEDLLDLARIESGSLHVDRKPVVVGTVLDDAIEQHRVLATDKGVSIIRGFDGRVGAAHVDRHRLTQALANLLGNALKFTPRGGTVTLGASTREDRVVIEVADTGPGIPREHLDHIFDRYYQRERRRDGLGLGLAIVKGIVDAHGGTVDVESHAGRGATFRLTLPRARDLATDAIAALDR